tara:strand:- start:1058 stop:1312 length:255 start_codon:yes stop_codon:yes gene_type:complete
MKKTRRTNEEIICDEIEVAKSDIRMMMDSIIEHRIKTGTTRDPLPNDYHIHCGWLECLIWIESKIDDLEERIGNSWDFSKGGQV